MVVVLASAGCAAAPDGVEGSDTPAADTTAAAPDAGATGEGDQPPGGYVCVAVEIVQETSGDWVVTAHVSPAPGAETPLRWTTVAHLVVGGYSGDGDNPHDVTHDVTNVVGFGEGYLFISADNAFPEPITIPADIVTEMHRRYDPASLVMDAHAVAHPPESTAAELPSVVETREVDVMATPMGASGSLSYSPLDVVGALLDGGTAAPEFWDTVHDSSCAMVRAAPGQYDHPLR